jgi:hypothetical protein
VFTINTECSEKTFIPAYWSVSRDIRITAATTYHILYLMHFSLLQALRISSTFVR